MYKKRTSIVGLLCSIAVALLIFACDDNGGGAPSYNYVCTNGIPANGTVDSANMQKCSSCNGGYLLTNDKTCTLNTGNPVALARILDSTIVNDSVSVAVDVTANIDGILHWVLYAGGTTKDSATDVINDAKTDSSVGIDRSGTDGLTVEKDSKYKITISELGFNTSYVLYAAVTFGSSSVLLEPIKFTTAPLGAVMFSAQPAATNIAQTTATITLTADKDATLYWVLYDSPQVPLHTPAGLKAAVAADAGIHRSNDGVPVSAGAEVTIPLQNLSVERGYYFYALLEENNYQVLSGQLKFTTSTGFAFVCANGTEADGQAATPDTNKCKDCNQDFTLFDGACIPQGAFTLHANGVTILCAGADDDDTGIVDGVTYTKRNRQQILADRALAVTSCTSGITDMSGLFQNVDYNGNIAHWDTSSVTNMSGMFRKNKAFVQNISDWDVSKVTNMHQMFLGDKGDDDKGSNPNISGWDTSSVENMSDMFKENANFNQDISSWDVSNVTNMKGMFRVARKFNADIGGWDVRKVSKENMGNMFQTAKAFSQDISEWCVSHIDTEPGSFDTDTDSGTWPSANKPQWGTKLGDNCQINYTDQPSVSAVTATTATISLTTSEDATLYWVLRTTPTTYGNSTVLRDAIGTTDVIQHSDSSGEAITDDMAYNIELDTLTKQNTYYLYTALEVEVDGTLVESVLFELPFVIGCNDGYVNINNACEAVQTFTVTNGIITCDGFDVGTAGIINNDSSTIYVKRTREQILADRSLAVTSCTTGIDDMSDLFKDTNFNGDISHWDTSSVTDMQGMFHSAVDFNQDIGNWDVSNVENMEEMFRNADAFNQNIGSWNVSKVTNMRSTFRHTAIFNQNIGSWNTAMVTGMKSMFKDSNAFNQDIGGWNVSNVDRDNMAEMFDKASAFTHNISQWCVSDIGSKPSNFDRDTDNTTWPQANKPKWGTSQGNNCDINFTSQPAAAASAITATTATISLTASKGATLHWILYTNQATHLNSGVLKTAINSSSGAQASVSDGVAAGDDEVVTINLTSLTGSTPYFFYSALEVVDDDNNVIESVLSEGFSFTTDNPCPADYQKQTFNTDGTPALDMNGDPVCEATVYTCDNGTFDTDFNNKTPSGEGDSNTFSDVQKCSGCNTNFGMSGDACVPLNAYICPGGVPATGGSVVQNTVKCAECTTDGYGLVNEICVELQNFSISATGIISCGGFDVGTAGIVNNDSSMIYVKRNREQIMADRSLAATACTTDITNMSDLFKEVANFNDNIGHWDTSMVTNMHEMFSKNTDFTQNISNWDVSKVTNMSQMFLGPKASGSEGNNPDISGWNTSSVTNMSEMFKENGNFNQDISMWDVSNVTNMSGMFRVAKAFNADIGDWDVSKVDKTNMGNMLRTATSFTHDLSEWCVSHIDDKPENFDDDISTTTWPDDKRPRWDTKLGDNCQVNFTSEPIVSEKNNTNGTATIQLTPSESATLYWVLRTSETTYVDSDALRAAIGSASVVQHSDINGESITDDTEPYSVMLQGLPLGNTYHFYAALEVEDNNGTVVESAVSAGRSFAVGCATGFHDVDNVCKQIKAFTVADNGIISCANFDVGTPGIVTGKETVYVRRNRSQILADLDRATTACTTGIDDMSDLFANSDFNGDISHWDTSSVTNMQSMFDAASNFNQNIGAWDVSDVDNMRTMFRFATAFNKDIGNWDVSDVDDMHSMFQGATSFNANIGGWDVSNVSRENMAHMLRGVTAFSQDISQWCVSHISTEPTSFDEDTMSIIWPDDKKPVWGTAQGNNCEVNFVSQPTATSNDATTATISLTPSEDATLYWILRATPTTYADSAALIADLDTTSDDIVADSGASGVTVTDDTAYDDIMLSSLVGQTTYYFYAALEIVDESSTLLESAVSELPFYTVCDATDRHIVGSECKAIQDFAVSATGIISCADVDVDTPGIVNNDSSKVYIKRNREQIMADSSLAATACTTGITDMSGLFKDDADFNGDISHWDTSMVTNMSDMFLNTKVFVRNLSNWDVSKVTNMSNMFEGGTQNGSDGSNPDISGWNTSSVTNMSSMFKENGNFNQDIGMWDVSKVTNMDSMFRVAKAFNADIGGWDVHNIRRAGMKNMFRTATAFTQDISGWCVSNIDEEPEGFDTDTDTGTWPVANRPVWGSKQSNNCAINFTVQPAVNSDNTAVTLTASKIGKLYWVLYNTQQSPKPTIADLKAATVAGNVVEISGSTGVDSLDDMQQEIALSTLPAGTYYFYAGLAIEADDGTLLESKLSDDAVTITIPSCQAKHHFSGGSCVLNQYICTGGAAVTVTDAMNAPTTHNMVEQCSATGCHAGYTYDTTSETCVLDLVGSWAMDTAIDASNSCSTSPACTVALNSGGTVTWSSDCASHAPLSTKNYNSFEVDGHSVIFSNTNTVPEQLDFTVDAVIEGVFQLNPHSTTLPENRYLCSQ